MKAILLYRLVASAIACVVAHIPLPAQPLPACVDQFKKVKMVVQSDTKSEKIRVALCFEPNGVVISPQKDGASEKSFTYTKIKSADYSYSRHPRLKESIGVAVFVGILTGGVGAVVGVVGFFLKEKRHWLTVHPQDQGVVLRLDKDNYKEILRIFEANGVQVTMTGKASKR